MPVAGKSKAQKPPKPGTEEWLIVNQFNGYQTKSDPTKIADGGNPMGQNTIINDGDRVSVRNFGYTVLGTLSATQERIQSLHTFHRRDGSNILMRTHAQYVDYYDEVYGDWVILSKIMTFGGAPYGHPFGFADYNINTDLHSYTYFGNGYDYFSRWNGFHTALKSAVTAGDTMIYVNSTAGANVASDSIVINGDVIQYSAIGFSTTLSQAVAVGDTLIYLTTVTGINPVASGFNQIQVINLFGGLDTITYTSIDTGANTITIAPSPVIYNNGVAATQTDSFVITANTSNYVINTPVAQAIEQNTGNPKGNIYMVANNRLFIGGIIATPEAVYFSKYGDAMTYTNAKLVDSTTATDPGIFNLGEGGGACTGMAQDEEGIYFIKKSMIYKANLTDALYTILPLKTFDGKSQNAGAITNKSVFSGANGIFFVTADNQISQLQWIPNINYPQIVPISDPIKPTVDTLAFKYQSGIAFQDWAYFSGISNQSTIEDTILLYNQRVNCWESPIIGMSASDFAIYDNGTTVTVAFGDATTANVYIITPTAVDNGMGVKANWRSKRFDMGLPTVQKEISNLFVDGYITANTNLTVSLLLDIDGYTQIYSTTFSGTESGYLFDAAPFNMFGLNPFGFIQFGSSQSTAEKKFRFYLNENLKFKAFYDFQIEFASDDIGQDWSVVNFGVKWKITDNEEASKLYRKFN